MEEAVFYSKVVGVTQPGRQELIARLAAGQWLHLIREPDNIFDAEAILVCDEHWQAIGYLSADRADGLAPAMDAGFSYAALVTEITGGTDDKPTRGVNIEVYRLTAQEAAADDWPDIR